ncbi:hypothetical protein PBI_APPA_61 [Microbacterium phage Appa]|uniref:Uncharacterized protein n=1 Tax=Microbacterium phage Appa TaxID=2182350 RepID=A0A2U8UHX7_9CAUD|nr:hypothetical protein HOT26_gp53 [Microbacterium phage Appa]AWN03242.1 hypothetical protein PBI_APPA_61 [Microbacterium phage Appa]
MSAVLSDMHEIDVLPDRSVVLDRDGDVWQYRGGLWCSYETASIGSERLARKYGPITVLSRGESRVTELDGATEPPPEFAEYADAGQFAASWNACTPEQREQWLGWARTLGERVTRCVMQDHEGAVEMQRRAFVSSVDLEHWARRLRRFAEVWTERPQNGPVIYSLGVMEGEGEHRHEVEHRVTVDDLLTAAAFAQHLAHERIDHAVIFGVHHWANATADVDIVSVDGRVLIEYSAIEALLTETGWTER